MLVLSRRKGEKIVIGDEILVEILSMSKDGVRLGISAPKQTSIHRHEVFAEIKDADRAAETAVAKIEQAFKKDTSPDPETSP